MAKVLVADDSELDRELTARALRKADPAPDAVLVEDGEQALQRLAEDPDIRLVLLDHRMPKMGAEDFLTAAPKELLDRVKVVLFSSAVSPSNVDRCLELGATEYVEKPTDPTEYGTAIRGALARHLGESTVDTVAP